MSDFVSFEIMNVGPVKVQPRRLARLTSLSYPVPQMSQWSVEKIPHPRTGSTGYAADLGVSPNIHDGARRKPID